MFADKGHKIQLLPNNKQRATFRQWSGTARWAYNYGLEKKIEAYEETGKSPGAYSLMKDVVKLKQTEEYAWLRDVSKSVPRMALMQLEVAYTNFFRRVKNGDAKPGFPKWKSKKWSKVVFHLEPDTVKIEGERIRLPKIGWIRMTKSPRFEGKLIGTVAISERAGKWYVSLSVETEHIPADNQGGDVGIDWGVKTLATLSDGTTYENPKALKHYEKLLARAQRQLVRKQKGSKRREKANLRVRRIYKRIADIRVNAHHQATSDVVNQYNFVAVEDLNIKGMVKNHCLAGAVSDASFGELKRQLQYKLAWNGGELVSVDRFFPSSKLCNACGCINDSLTLADRTWTCTDCGTHHDRDHNAAKNLRNWGLKHRTVQTVLDVEGKDSSPPAKRQEGCVSISPSPVD